MSSRACVLVTGGAGYIGSHACKALRRAGFDPVVFDNLSIGHRDAVKWGRFIFGDVRNPTDVAFALARCKPALVMHFAALASVAESVENPSAYYANNVLGTMNLLDACCMHEVQGIVFSSSCAIYGIPSLLPITEAAPPSPISPYGRTKLYCERLIEDYARAYGLRHVTLRYFNAAGADPEGELGERHDPETHLIPRVLQAASGQLPCLEIFGDDYDTPDGTCVRDYVHVSDLADAHVAATERLIDGGGNLTANLGAGRGVSIGEIIAAVQDMTKLEIATSFRPRRPGDPPVLFADASLARKELGFRAAHSRIADIVRTACRFSGIDVAMADEGAAHD